MHKDYHKILSMVKGKISEICRDYETKLDSLDYEELEYISTLVDYILINKATNTDDMTCEIQLLIESFMGFRECLTISMQSDLTDPEILLLKGEAKLMIKQLRELF